MQSLIDRFHEMEQYFFSHVSINSLDYQTIAAFETGVLAAGLNPAFLLRMDDGFVHDLEMCQSYFAQKKLPWAFIVPEHLSLVPKIENQIIKQFQLVDTGVGMSLDLLSHSFHFLNNSLQVKLMNDDLHAWSIPLTHGFQSTPEITQVYTSRHIEALKKTRHLYHYSGFFADEPVVSVTLTVKDGIARIDDLATIPKFQKKGFASALMHYILQKASEFNVQFCFLEASLAGLNLYKNLGFQSLFKNFYYEKIC